MAEPMTNERLAEIRSDSDAGRWEFSYDGGRAVRELLAEVDEVRAENARLVVERNEARDVLAAYSQMAGYAAPITIDDDGTPHWPADPGSPG